jgi:hypothetical protein
MQVESLQVESHVAQGGALSACFSKSGKPQSLKTVFYWRENNENDR